MQLPAPLLYFWRCRADVGRSERGAPTEHRVDERRSETIIRSRAWNRCVLRPFSLRARLPSPNILCLFTSEVSRRAYTYYLASFPRRSGRIESVKPFTSLVLSPFRQCHTRSWIPFLISLSRSCADGFSMHIAYVQVTHDVVPPMLTTLTPEPSSRGGAAHS